MQKTLHFGQTIAIAMLFLIAGCVGRAYLIVDYQVPESTPQLADQTVRILIKDQRKIKSVLSPAAAEIFSDFEDRYSLAWITSDSQRVLAGEYQLNDLLYRTIEKRLIQLGAAVTSDADSTATPLTLTLTKLNVNQLGVKWYAAMTCEAKLTPANQYMAKETVSGSAERVRIVGRKGADMVLSQVFSDVLNRIDWVKLFQTAKLI